MVEKFQPWHALSCIQKLNEFKNKKYSTQSKNLFWKAVICTTTRFIVKANYVEYSCYLINVNFLQ